MNGLPWFTLLSQSGNSMCWASIGSSDTSHCHRVSGGEDRNSRRTHEPSFCFPALTDTVPTLCTQFFHTWYIYLPHPPIPSYLCEMLGSRLPSYVWFQHMDLQKQRLAQAAVSTEWGHCAAFACINTGDIGSASPHPDHAQAYIIGMKQKLRACFLSKNHHIVPTSRIV